MGSSVNQKKASSQLTCRDCDRQGLSESDFRTRGSGSLGSVCRYCRAEQARERRQRDLANCRPTEAKNDYERAINRLIRSPWRADGNPWQI